MCEFRRNLHQSLLKSYSPGKTPKNSRFHVKAFFPGTWKSFAENKDRQKAKNKKERMGLAWLVCRLVGNRLKILGCHANSSHSIRFASSCPPKIGRFTFQHKCFDSPIVISLTHTTEMDSMGRNSMDP